MVMDVVTVCVGGNDKSVFALGKPHGKFIAHLVGFLGGDLIIFQFSLIPFRAAANALLTGSAASFFCFAI